MGQRRVKQYKKIIKKELSKAHKDILFDEIKVVRSMNFISRVKFALWIIKGE